MGPFFFVAEIQDDLVGFISGSVHVSDGLAVIPNGKKYVEIDDVYVSPPFRQLGIGSELLEHLLAQAKEQDFTFASLYSAT